MKKDRFILALDQGTTSSRAVIFDQHSQLIALEQETFKQSYPEPGWVEHNPYDIWSTQLAVAQQVLKKAHISPNNLAALGITNQRETTILWNKKTGVPVYPAIVWQDRRTAAYCESLKNEGHEASIQAKTGLPLDPYFSATKIHWIMNHVNGVRELAQKGELAFGTVDSWLIWHFTKGAQHITDVTNASRTLLFNIHTLSWDDALLDVFDIPANILPSVAHSSGHLAMVDPSFFDYPLPITGLAGDQQAALFGQMCVKPGMAKNTYGTGCFLMCHTGKEAVISQHQLLTTLACKINEETHYALEGSVFTAGSLIQWLRDELGIIKEAKESETYAQEVIDSAGVYIVPAFNGLGAPYWQPQARGTIFGLTRGITAKHIVRAALEAIAFQVQDVLLAIEKDLGYPITVLRVDGGASINNFLMQFQADLLALPVVRPRVIETTALGAAYLAGLAVGFWPNIEVLQTAWQEESLFMPSTSDKDFALLKKEWARAVNAAIIWAEEASKFV